MRKKVVSVMLAAAMCVSMTACGSKEAAPAETKAEAAETKAEAETEAAAEKSGDPIRVCVVYTGN